MMRPTKPTKQQLTTPIMPQIEPSFIMSYPNDENVLEESYAIIESYLTEELSNNNEE